MIKLSLKHLSDPIWQQQEISVPSFDVTRMRKTTGTTPLWMHFGAGNIFRGYIARLAHILLEKGLITSGIIAVDTFDFDIIDKVFKPYDDLTLLVQIKPDGSMLKSVVAGVGQSLKGNAKYAEDWAELNKCFENPSLQMVSFTLTEKGYSLRGMNGELVDDVLSDMNNGSKSPSHAMGILTSMLLTRYKAGAAPISLVSMDNCSHNGDKLRDSVFEIAQAWIKKGFADEGFFEYISNQTCVSFPWSMIDKITPRPSKDIGKLLTCSGIDDMKPIITSKGTYIAPFVNAEISEYLVIEDSFPNGRPSLEKANVFLTDRETVDNTERMKVTTCLNPLHTAMSIFGCLLGYETIADEMRDPLIKKFLMKLGNGEGMQVVVNSKIIDPMDFINDVIENRFPNPYIPHTPQTIMTDTSQKIAIRFGETIKSYAAIPSLDPKSLILIPLTLAGWFRYLLMVDDDGSPMPLSADPMKDELTDMLKGIRLGSPDSYNSNLKKILGNKSLFGVDLYEVGLADKVESMYLEMISAPGAVRATLQKYVNGALT